MGIEVGVVPIGIKGGWGEEKSATSPTQKREGTGRAWGDSRGRAGASSAVADAKPV